MSICSEYKDKNKCLCSICIAPESLEQYSERKEIKSMAGDRSWLWVKVDQTNISELEPISPVKMNDVCPYCNASGQYLVKIPKFSFMLRLCDGCNTLYYGKFEDTRNVVAMEVAKVIKEWARTSTEQILVMQICDKLIPIFSKDNPDWNEEKFKEACK